MIKKQLIMLILCTGTSLSIAHNLMLVDTIQAVVYGPESTDIITMSDIRRRGIDGSVHTLDNKIDECLIRQDAAGHNQLPAPDEVEKDLANVAKDNKIPVGGMEDIFRAAGYTKEEGKKQFQTMTAVNRMLGFRVMSRLIVPEKEIVAFHEENPQVIEASYYIRRAEVPFTFAPTKKELKEKLLSDQFYNQINWSSPFWINHSEVAPDKQFIYKMPKNQIAINPIEGGFELFELLDKKEERLVPLEERYEEIVNLLRQPKYQELMDAYKKELYSNASILYLTPPSLQ